VGIIAFSSALDFGLIIIWAATAEHVAWERRETKDDEEGLARARNY